MFSTIWLIGALMVLGVKDSYSKDQKWTHWQKFKYTVSTFVLWPYFLGQVITIYIDQWERYTLYRDTGIDRNETR